MPLATYDDARAEFARNAGRDNPDHEWILTPFDTWERNPAYRGPKGRHPEDDYDENGIHYADEPSVADELLTRALKEALGLVDTRVLDHFVVAHTKTTSFAERGLL